MTNRGGASPLPKGETMEINFENINTCNEKMLVEIYKKLTIVYRIMAVCGLVIAACGLCMFLSQVLLAYEIDVGLLFSAIVWFVVAYLGFSGPKKLAKDFMKSRLTMSNGQPIVQKRQFAERIISYTPGSTNLFDYCAIKKIYSLKSCYVLIFAHNSGFLALSRDGFTKGTFVEFKQFLRTKRPDLKIPE